MLAGVCTTEDIQGDLKSCQHNLGILQTADKHLSVAATGANVERAQFRH